jgi:hypothetical protein
MSKDKQFFPDGPDFKPPKKVDPADVMVSAPDPAIVKANGKVVQDERNKDKAPTGIKIR